MSRPRRADKVESLAGFRTEKTEPTVPYGLLKAARKSGQLNLSGRGLTEGNFDILACIATAPLNVYHCLKFINRLLTGFTRSTLRIVEANKATL